MGHSVLDLFMEYGCVFVGEKDGSRIGKWGDVNRGDLFIVSDGATAVAIGEATGTFKSYDETGIRFRKCDADEFIYDGVVLCPARLVLLDETERGQYWGIDTRKRFCRANGAAAKVRSAWTQKNNSQKSESFDIDTRVASLVDERCPNRLIQNAVKYSIPIYQRPYSWGENELRRLMEDLHQGLSNAEPVFMGTIQLSYPIPLQARGNMRSYNVIDGQQRLTTFIILLSILERICGNGIDDENSVFNLARRNFRTSVNKRAAQDDLDAFFDFFASRMLTDETPTEQLNNPYIANAKILYGLLKEIASSQAVADDESDVTIATGEDLTRYATRLREFLASSIKLVVIETRAGLSKTLKIFNTINSSGLDLGSEDIFKVRFYEYLRKRGQGEEVFDRISEIYERVEEHNRHPFAGVCLSMAQILSTCQRMLIARYDLSVVTFAMSQETFFERLFDTVLGVHAWDEFLPLLKDKYQTGAGILTIEDVQAAVECHVDYLKACEADVDLRIARRMFWETRYGYAWDFPVLAMIKGIVNRDSLKGFTYGLFKSLVPPSIYFAKHVYHGRACLLELLKSIWDGSFTECNSVGDWCRSKWSFDGRTLAQMIDAALGYEIAWTPKWKNLICRIVEYIKSPEKDDALYARLFETGFDIEHIQSYTDEKDYKRVREVWGGELNMIGNLAMFERDLNRSVHNHTEQKVVAYAKSAYRSLKELKSKVHTWVKEDAIERRKAITKMLCDFLLSD